MADISGLDEERDIGSNWGLYHSITSGIYRFLDDSLVALGLREKAVTIQEVYQRIQSEAEIWSKYEREYQQSELWQACKEKLVEDPLLDQVEFEESLFSTTWQVGDRKEFWGRFAKIGFFRKVISSLLKSGPPSIEISPHPLLEKAVHQSEREQHEGEKVAVELGCGGNLDNAIFLLSKGWKVILVENSEEVIDLIQKIGSRAIESGALQVICADMETYQFPSNVQLIFANDALPYCNPAKVVDVWNRAYDALSPGGRIVGNFFAYPKFPLEEQILRNMGAWFTDKPVVTALLNHKQYEKEVCEFDSRETVKAIQFIGRKVNP